MSDAGALAAAAAISPAWKWGAMLIAVALLVLAGLLTSVGTKAGLRQLYAGKDGRASTSKLQWLLWLIVIVFAYVTLYVLRIKQGNLSAISDIPVNLLTVLGFSTGTAAAAKGITSGYYQTGKLAKPAANAGSAAQGGSAAKSSTAGILVDDSGQPELAKIQVMAFTLIAIGAFLAELITQIVHNPVVTTLPNLDSSLLVLMGISHGGYLGKKLVTFGSPGLYQATPSKAVSGTAVTVSGANLGAAPGGELTMNGSSIPVTSWSDTSIVFAVPDPVPGAAAGSSAAANGPSPDTGTQLAVMVRGQQSNSIPFTAGP